MGSGSPGGGSGGDSDGDSGSIGGGGYDAATLQGIDLSMQELRNEVQSTLAEQRREMKGQVCVM